MLEDTAGIHDTDEERWRLKLQHCQGKIAKTCYTEGIHGDPEADSGDRKKLKRSGKNLTKKKREEK